MVFVIYIESQTLQKGPQMLVKSYENNTNFLLKQLHIIYVKYTNTNIIEILWQSLHNFADHSWREL